MAAWTVWIRGEAGNRRLGNLQLGPTYFSFINTWSWTQHSYESLPTAALHREIYNSPETSQKTSPGPTPFENPSSSSSSSSTTTTTTSSSSSSSSLCLCLSLSRNHSSVSSFRNSHFGRRRNGIDLLLVQLRNPGESKLALFFCRGIHRILEGIYEAAIWEDNAAINKGLNKRITFKMTGGSDNEQEGTAQTSGKRMRRKSVVWEHFTVESLGGGCTRACCKRCKQTFAYSTGSKFAGTSHLKRHLALGICPRNRNKDKNQLTPYTPSSKNDGSIDTPKRRYRWNPGLTTVFDQDRSRQDIARMIIVHEFPLHMVEHPGFINFAQNLQPQFKMVTVSTLEADILEMYQKEKQNLMQLLGTMPGRISLNLDRWVSSQSLPYMCITGQFIDGDWRLHRRLLNFLPLSSQPGNVLSDAIGTCLSNWNLENKLFSITLENGSSNDGISSNLRDYLSNKNALAHNGQLFVASYAHILNLVVKDGFGAIHEIVCKIRESIKYVKSSPALDEKFVEIVQQFQIPSTRNLSVDVPAQWNTTFLMLMAALDYKQAFAYLETCDSTYIQAPTVDEWKKVETVCKYLKVLYDAANVFTGISNPTSNLYFHEAWKIKLELAHAAASEDVFTRSVAGPMHEKFDSYWKDCNLILAIAVVMDPRFKMKLVEFSFTKIYGENAGLHIKTVNDGIHDLYLEYIAQPLPLTPAYIEQGEQGEQNLQGEQREQGERVEQGERGEQGGQVQGEQVEQSELALVPSNGVDGGALLSSGDGLLDFDVFISEMSSTQQTKSELDQYLDEALLPRIQEFDILEWWKLNKLKYPTLSKMARDVLAIAMSTGSSEFIFSTENQSIDDYRSTLRPETLQAIFCAKDWLQQQIEEDDQPNAIVKMEF